MNKYTSMRANGTYIFDEGGALIAQVAMDAVDGQDPKAMADEIVRRYNAHRDLIKAIDLALESGAIANADPNTHALLKEARGRIAPNKPYTVVIAFRDDDDPQANREYTMQVLGFDGQDAAKRAIDQLIAARGLADAENMDTWRVDYDTIAIFEGNLTNLAR